MHSSWIELSSSKEYDVGSFDFFFSAPLLSSSLLGTHNSTKGIGCSNTHSQTPFQKSKRGGRGEVFRDATEQTIDVLSEI